MFSSIAPSSRCLTPSSPPFVFPRSSPTFTSRSDTNTNTSTPSSFSLLGSPSSSLSTAHSLTPTGSSQYREKGDLFPSLSTLATSVAPATITTTTSFNSSSPTKAKPFGAGWKSTSTNFSSMREINPFLPAARHQEDARIARARSPGPRILPSQDESAPSFRKMESATTRDLFPINTSPSIPHEFELYTPTSPHSQGYLPFGATHQYPYPISPTDSITDSSLHRHPSISTIDIELDDHGTPFPVYPSSSTGLLHHQSVPNLPFQQGLSRRPSGMSVRFKEEVPDVPQGIENDGIPRGLRRMPGFNFGQLGGPKNKLSSSRSMPVIQMVGEGRNVFIHRVNANLTEDDLRDYASEFGDVVSVKIPARTTKPHAFVMFKKPEQAQRFIVHLKMGNVECEFGKANYQVQNKALEDPNSANLYVAGLPVTMTYEELADLLAPGKICSWKPLVDEAGNRRGPVMARLQTRPQAEDVIRRLNGKYYPGMSEKLQVRIADSDEQKHFKRQQNVWRERVPPAERNRDIVNSKPLWNQHEAEQDEIPDLLNTREYLASQLEAIDQKLSRTAISPRAGHSIAFPNHQAASDHPTYPSETLVTPTSSRGEDREPRRTCNDSYHEEWATGIIGPAPTQWEPARSNLPFIHSTDRSAIQTGGQASFRPVASFASTHSRQQTLSLGSLAQTQPGDGLGLGADLWAAAGSLKNVKSSPELGGRGERASKTD
ncbi:hypothetical protein I317_00369 [Kwoniella heveanensis CBS 569]|nr:hypothetical protein I317_00369 [Kwoniella heveanensis CBS 569]